MLWKVLKKSFENNKSSYFEYKGNVETYNEVLLEVEQTAKRLRKLFPKKCKCAILCKDAINTAKGILACICADIIPVPLSQQYGDIHCNKILTSIQPQAYFTDYDEKSMETLHNISCYNVNTGEVKGVSDTGEYEEILQDVVLIMCTSGTTGNPKGVLISEEGLLQNIKDISLYFHINADDKILIARPLYHCAVLTGEFFISIFLGANICFYSEKYNPMNIIKYIQENSITVMGGTPTLFHHVSIFAKRFHVKLPLHAIAISGECLTEEVAKSLRKVLPNTDIYNVYGLTEASPRVSFLAPCLFDEFPESVGIPLASIKVKIVDQYGQELPVGKDGELIIQGPNVMLGYYRSEELTNKKIVNGWLHTGDIACKNEQDLLFIKSRADDMIIKAGMNIYPKEIENILKKQEVIKEVVAFGIQNQIGQSIGLNIVLEDNYKNINKKKLIQICCDSLPEYLYPDEVNIIEALEKNASGKIIRRKKNNSEE